jgi:hypothetical protein
MRRLEIALLVTAVGVNAARVFTFNPAQPALLLQQGGVTSAQPAQHPQQQPDQPSTQPGGNTSPIGREGNPANGTGTAGTGQAARWQRPFTLDAPDSEARFTDEARRLAAMEQRLAASSADVLRRIGEARTLPPERQNAAVLDILQDLAQQHVQVQRYLVAARTAWTGDLDPAAGSTQQPSTE